MNSTQEKIRDAIKALGYDPERDQVLSMYADVDQIIVRRMQPRPEGGVEVVEDKTFTMRRDLPEAKKVDDDYELGPLE